jgi:hypothetical protein
MEIIVQSLFFLVFTADACTVEVGENGRNHSSTINERYFSYPTTLIISATHDYIAIMKQQLETRSVLGFDGVGLNPTDGLQALSGSQQQSGFMPLV